MSLLRRIFRIPAPSKPTTVDSSTSERLEEAEATLVRERQEYRKKIQRVQSGTRHSARVMNSMAGTMIMIRGHEGG